MRTYSEVCMDYAKDALECGHLDATEIVDMKIIQTLAARLHKALTKLNKSHQPEDWDLATELEAFPKDQNELTKCGAV